MARPIRMPTPGQMTEECTILAWFKKAGETVKKGDPLFEIETDKSNMEIEAFEAGTLLRIDAPVGTTVPVETVIAWIGEPGEQAPSVEDTAPAPPNALAPTSAPAASAAPSAASAATSAPAGALPSEKVAPMAPTTTPVVAATIAATPAQPARRLAISPRASRVAAELAVDPRSITGSGPGGRIVERDVRAAAQEPVAPTLAASPAALATPVPSSMVVAATSAPTVSDGPAPSAAPEGGEKLSRIRQVIARRLTESVTTIPQYTVTVAIDMTGLMALRADLKRHGSPITITDFIHAATVQALVELPTVNARTDGKTLWRRDAVHLGIAVSIPDGLLVPVVRDAQALSVSGLHDRTVALIAGAREGTLGPDELSGSTFSVSNMGMYGVEQFSAIINPGESGILAVSSVKAEPVVMGGGIAIRQMMRLTLTADHRLVDGELGARFLNAVRDRLQDADAFRAQASAG